MSVIERGRCSACHQPARRGPSGSWWHEGAECHNRSITIYQPYSITPVEGREGVALGPATPEDLPAEFIPDRADTP